MAREAVDAMFADEGVHATYAGAELNAQCVGEGLVGLRNDRVQQFPARGLRADQCYLRYDATTLTSRNLRRRLGRKRR
jgi:hypothetical protein